MVYSVPGFRPVMVAVVWVPGIVNSWGDSPPIQREEEDVLNSWYAWVLEKTMNENTCTHLILHKWSCSSSLRQRGRPSGCWCWWGWRTLLPVRWEHQKLKKDWNVVTSWIWVRKGKVIAETSKGTHWWPVCLSEVDSPDCCWLHTHGSDSPSLESARSKWSRSCSGAPSHPLHARHLSSDSGCGIQWWKMLEPPSEQWRSWCRYRRNPSQWGNPELEENLLGYVKYQAFSTLFFFILFFLHLVDCWLF